MTDSMGAFVRRMELRLKYPREIDNKDQNCSIHRTENQSRIFGVWASKQEEITNEPSTKADLGHQHQLDSAPGSHDAGDSKRLWRWGWRK
jgi:hypothetical protein